MDYQQPTYYDFGYNSTFFRGNKSTFYGNDYVDSSFEDFSFSSSKMQQIAANKILISGSTNLDDWTNTTDTTKIDGGNIQTNTIDADRIKASDIDVAVGIGDSAKIKLDGANKRITINDGSNERIRLGQL